MAIGIETLDVMIYSEPKLYERFEVQVHAKCPCGSRVDYTGPLPVPQMICSQCQFNFSDIAKTASEEAVEKAKRRNERSAARN